MVCRNDEVIEEVAQWKGETVNETTIKNISKSELDDEFRESLPLGK